MLDLASSAFAALSPYLPAISRTSAHTSQEVAARALYELLGSALRQIGARSAWDAYLGDPSATATVERLLASAMDKSSDLARDVERAVHEVTNDNSYTYSNQSGAQAGRGGNIVGRDQNNNKTNYGGIVAVIAVIVVAVVAILAGRAVYESVKSSGLSADSTCNEFLQAPQDEELRAIRKIGVDEGVNGTGSPLALPAISYACSGQPNARLGEVIARFRGQF